MSEEIHSEPGQEYEAHSYAQSYQPAATTYSYFYPVLILVFGFFLWNGYQLYGLTNQWRSLDQQKKSLMPTLAAAQTAHNQFKTLLEDLAKTSTTNANAAQIMKEAGLRYTPNGSGSTNAPATPTSPDSK